MENGRKSLRPSMSAPTFQEMRMRDHPVFKYAPRFLLFSRTSVYYLLRIRLYPFFVLTLGSFGGCFRGGHLEHLV
jgi:hypothetical protein